VSLAPINLELALKANAFSVITQNNGHCAFQGHSRLPILKLIEKAHMRLPISD